MKLKRKLRPRPEIRAILAKLRRIQRRHKLTNVDYSGTARSVRKLIKSAGVLDEGLEQRVHEYIDHHTELMRAGLRRQHDAYLFELDELLMLVRPLVKGYAEMVVNDTRTLQEMRFAVTAVIEDLADDDRPKESLLRDRELTP